MIDTQLYNIDTLLQDASRKDLVELLEMTDTWASPEDCKFYLYQPNDIPKIFHISPVKTRVIVGGNRSGKTNAHVEDYAMQFLGETPKSLRGLIPSYRLDPKRRLRFCVEDYPNSFVKVIWPYIQQLIPSDKIKDVIKDSGRIRSIVNYAGGFLEFMFYDQEASKHQGASRHSIGYDEEPPSAHRDEGLMRLVDTDGDETFSFTPVTGLRYLYDDLIDRRGREVEKNYEFIYGPTGKIIDAIPGNIVDRNFVDGDPQTHVFYSCIFDNKAIPKAGAIRILSKFDKDTQLMRAKGKAMFLSGLVYKDYSEAGLVKHMIDPFNDWLSDPTYHLFIAIDPHPRVPHAVTFGCVYKGVLIIVDELFIDTTAEGLAKAIYHKCIDVHSGNIKMPECMIIDLSAFSPDPIKKGCLAWSLIDEFDKLGISSPLIAGSKDLDNGILATKRLLKPNASGIPNLFVTANCQNWRREITHYCWSEWNRNVTNNKGAKQKPVDKDDHMMENTRRLALFCWPQLAIESQVYPDELDEIKPDRHPRYNRVHQVGRSTITGY